MVCNPFRQFEDLAAPKARRDPLAVKLTVSVTPKSLRFPYKQSWLKTFLFVCRTAPATPGLLITLNTNDTVKTWKMEKTMNTLKTQRAVKIGKTVKTVLKINTVKTKRAVKTEKIVI